MQNEMATLQLQSPSTYGTLIPMSAPTDPDMRLENLRRLIAESGGPSALAKRLGYSNASFLVQMAGPAPIRKVTEKTARSIEQKLGLPRGYLDQSDAPTVTVDTIRMIGQLLEDEGVALPPVKFAELVAFALSERISEPSIRRVVKLLRTEPQ